MTIEAVLELVDSAPVFAAPKPLTLEERRQIGAAELGRLLGELVGAPAETRMDQLRAIAEQLGELVAADAIVETFAKAALEQAAAGAGMIGEHGARPVKAAIAGGLKEGKKRSRDLGAARELVPIEGRGGAQAPLRAPHDNGRAPVARDDVDISRSSASPPPSPPGAANPPETLADDLSSAASPPVPPRSGESENETLANEDEGAEDDGADEPPNDEIDPDTFRYCAGLDQSDVDNGKRLIAYFGRDLLVRQEDDVAAGQMLAWTGTHWDLAGGEALAHLIGQRVGDLIKQEAAYIDATPVEARAIGAGDAAAKELKTLDPDADALEVLSRVEKLNELVAAAKKARGAVTTRRTNRRKWGVSTKNAGRIAAMLKCAAPHLRRHPDAFNADALKVATLTHTLSFVPIRDDEDPEPGGARPLVDRETGRVQYRLLAKRGHDRADMLTAVIPCAYDKDAACKDFEVFLDLFQPEPNKRRTVQQFSGMSLTAQPVQRVMYHTGTGGNGKSVYLEVLSRVFGDGLGVGVPAETVSGQVQNNPSAPTPDIARCYAKRFLRIAELPKDAPLKAETIKKLTGGERWPVRTMYKGYFEFKPTAKPHMSGNGEPKFDGADGGMRRRLIIVPWSVTLPDEKHRDFEEVVSEIVSGGSGILNWLIAGTLDFLNSGLVISEDVLKRTADHFNEMDPCQQFIDAHVKPDPGGAGVTARAMYEAYKAFAEANGMAKLFETKFGRTMKTKLTRDDSKRVHVYVDVALHDLPAAPESQPSYSGGPADEPF